MSKVTKTDIQWCDYSVNPIRADRPILNHLEISEVKSGWHCERVSEGCKNCYSATLNKRFGTGIDYAADQTRKVEFFLDEQAIRHMLTFRPKGPFKNGRTRAAVFPFDMTDWMGWWVPDEWLYRLMAVFIKRHDVDWLVLTKRSARQREFMGRFFGANLGRERGIVYRLAQQMETHVEAQESPSWPFPHLYLGVSAENQPRADGRIPELLQTPAAVRFVSAEPLLGPIDLGFPPVTHRRRPGDFDKLSAGEKERVIGMAARAEYIARCNMLDWVIVGGESGPGARPCRPDWVRSILTQCRDAGVPAFNKQGGAWRVPREGEEFDTSNGQAGRPPAFIVAEDGTVHCFHESAGPGGIAMIRRGGKNSDPSEWPEDIRVREMPGGTK